MDKEQIYDRDISPLMAKILKICKKHKIAMVASFSIPTEEDDGLCCTSALLEDECDPPEKFVDILMYIRQQESVTMITTRDGDGNVIRSDAIVG